MTATVALYARAYEDIRPRLDALGLDIDVLTFDQTGALSRDGAPIKAEEAWPELVAGR